MPAPIIATAAAAPVVKAAAKKLAPTVLASLMKRRSQKAQQG